MGLWYLEDLALPLEQRRIRKHLYECFTQLSRTRSRH